MKKNNSYLINARELKPEDNLWYDKKISNSELINIGIFLLTIAIIILAITIFLIW